MPISNIRHIIYILAFLLLILGAGFPSQIVAWELPAQDVVFLVDCSRSTKPYVRPIAGILSRFVGGADYGDSFACYQFSHSPVLVARKKIERAGDVAQLKSQLQQLHVAGKHTNYSPALEKALDEIKASLAARPANERILMLITDGRREATDTASEGKTLQRLLQSYSNLVPGEDYFFYCFYIGTWPESDLQSYLNEAGAYIQQWPEDGAWLDQLTLADVRILDESADLGRLPNTPTQSSFSISFLPRRPPTQITSIEIDVDAEFTKKTLDKFFRISPRRIFCKREPWTETFNFETRGFTSGSFLSSFIFRPSEPRVLLLSPRNVNFNFSVVEPLQVFTPALFTFGPTGLRGKYSETIDLLITPGQADFPKNTDAISAVADIGLPDGVRLDVSKVMRGKKIVVNITVSRDRAVNRRITGEYTGTIHLSSKTGWLFSKDAIVFSVDVSQRRINYETLLRYLAIATGLGLVVILLLLPIRRVRTAALDCLAHKTQPVGKLIIMRDPTKGIAKNINIARLAEKMKANEVIVGVGKSVDVELLHRSMIDVMYRFWGLRARDAVHTIVEAGVGTDEVLVNDISRTGQVQLMHFDMVKLGAFEFRYEVPMPLQQVAVYFLNGEIQQGWLLSWKAETEGFRFLNRDDLPERNESYVRFYELKAVAFVRDFEGELTNRLLDIALPRSGHLVKLAFSDGEELTGYVLDWKNVGGTFYLIPDSMGENVMFFLIEKNTLKDISLIKEDNSGAKLARKKFARVIDMLRSEVRG